MTPAELALTDFVFFTEHFLELKLWDCQKNWAEKVQSVIDGDYSGLLCLGPADHGKTSRVVVPLILWLLARDRKNRIILVGNTDAYAEQIGRAVANRIELTPSLSKHFGLRKGLKWAANELQIERPNWKDKDPSLLCLGAGAEVQSQRADYLLTDDIATRRNSRTEGQRQAIKSYFFTDLKSRLDKVTLTKNKTLVFGHRVDAGDLYADLVDKKGWLTIQDRAILEDSTKKILAPEGHTYDELSEARADDPVGFELLYQQRAVSSGKFLTRTNMELCRKPGMRFYQSLPGNVRSEFTSTWISLDPAFSTNRWSSYAVMMLWGLRPDRTRTLLWGMRDKFTPENLLAFMEVKHRLFNPDHFIIEANQGQTLLIPHMRRIFPNQSSKFIPVWSVNPNGQMDTELQEIFNLYCGEKPMVEIPYYSAQEQAFAHAMTEEYVGFPDFRYRDILMSQYIGEKGMGLITNHERKATTGGRGVVGSVVQGLRRRRFIYS